MRASHQHDGTFASHYTRHTFSHNQPFQPRSRQNQPFDAQDLSRRLLVVQVQQQKQEQQEEQRQRKQLDKLQKKQNAALRKRNSMPLPRRFFSLAPKENREKSATENAAPRHAVSQFLYSEANNSSSTASVSASSSSAAESSRRSSTSISSSSTSVSSRPRSVATKPSRLESTAQSQAHGASRHSALFLAPVFRPLSPQTSARSRDEDEFGPLPVYQRKTHSRGSHLESPQHGSRVDWTQGDESKDSKKTKARPLMTSLKSRLGGGKNDKETAATSGTQTQHRTGLFWRLRKTA
ncbi:hypothetical protein BROUX41_000368 [Berkeleyomyces rouxiae]|uniref:uncharacterized protein n=1 Tax=Berkeleyomyces rouxiae TaxID=2035830 RepID=UPI003B802A45